MSDSLEDLQTLQIQIISAFGLERLKPVCGQSLELRFELIGLDLPDSLRTMRLALPMVHGAYRLPQQRTILFHLDRRELSVDRLQQTYLRINLKWMPRWAGSRWLKTLTQQLNPLSASNITTFSGPATIEQQTSSTSDEPDVLCQIKADEYNEATILLVSLYAEGSSGRAYTVQLGQVRVQVQLRWEQHGSGSLSLWTKGDRPTETDQSRMLMMMRLRQNELGRPMDAQTERLRMTTTVETTHDSTVNILGLETSELRSILYPNLTHCLENESLLGMEASVPVDDRCVHVYIRGKSVRATANHYDEQLQRLLAQLDRPAQKEYTERLVDTLVMRSLRQGHLCLLQTRRKSERLGEQSEWRFRMSLWLERKVGASLEWMNRVNGAEMKKLQLITLRNALNQQKLQERRIQINGRIAHEVRNRMRQWRRQADAIKRWTAESIAEDAEDGTDDEPEEEGRTSLDTSKTTDQMDSRNGLTSESRRVRMKGTTDQEETVDDKTVEARRTGKWRRKKWKQMEMDQQRQRQQQDKENQEYQEEQDEQDLQALSGGQLDIVGVWNQEQEGGKTGTGRSGIGKDKRTQWNKRMRTTLNLRFVIRPFQWVARALYEAFVDTYSGGALQVQVGTAGEQMDAPPPPNAPFSEMGARSVTAALKQLNWGHTRGPFLYARIEES